MPANFGKEIAEENCIKFQIWHGDFKTGNWLNPEIGTSSDVRMDVCGGG